MRGRIIFALSVLVAASAVPMATASFTDVRTYSHYVLQSATDAVSSTSYTVPANPHGYTVTARSSVWEISATYEATGSAASTSQRSWQLKIDGTNLSGCTWKVALPLGAGSVESNHLVRCQNATSVNAGTHTVEIVATTTGVNPVTGARLDVVLRQTDSVTDTNLDSAVTTIDGHTDTRSSQTNGYVNASRDSILTRLNSMWTTINGTRSDLDSYRTQFNTTTATILNNLADLDYHAHLIGGYVNSSQAQLRFHIDSEWAAANASIADLDYHAHLLGTYVNDTRNVERMEWSAQNATLGDLDNHFHQTDSYINTTYDSLLGNITNICNGGGLNCNVTVNTTGIELVVQDALVQTQKPIADSIDRILWIIVIAVAIAPIFKTEWPVARYVSVCLFVLSVFLGLAAFGGKGWDLFVIGIGLLGVAVASAQRPHAETAE